MRIAADACHAFEPKIEDVAREAGLLEEWHDETSQAAVDVQPNIVPFGEHGQHGDVIHAAIWEIDS